MKPHERSADGPVAVILLYHRVADSPTDAFGNQVRPGNFAAHLELISTRFTPTPLHHLAARGPGGGLPGRSIVVTFDDGYADNLHVALPLLERHGVPATIFVATAALEGLKEFWWDRLERILLGSRRLPRRLELIAGGTPLRIDLDGWERYDAAAWPDHSRWTAYGDRDPTPRHRALREIWDRLRTLPMDTREEAMRRLAAWAGERESPPTRPLMTRAEVAELARAELVDVGAHSVTHASLAAMPPARRWSEVAGSRDMLAALLGHEISLFAYPFGKPGDYDRATIEMVRRAGFMLACTSRGGAVLHDTPPLELPRVAAGDCDGEALEATLEEMFRSGTQQEAQAGSSRCEDQPQRERCPRECARP